MNQLQNINFHGTPITVIEKDGTQYVAMKPIVEAMGLDWTRQFRKITNDPVLNSTIAEMAMVAEDGKERKMICLPLDFLNGWLFKIDANRYKKDFDRFNTIVTYQQKCYRVLFDYFHKGGAINPEATAEQVAVLLEKWKTEMERSVRAELALEKQNARLLQLEQTVERFKPYISGVDDFGKVSKATGLPRDIVVRTYIRSDSRPHRPNAQEAMRLYLLSRGLEQPEFSFDSDLQLVEERVYRTGE